MLYAPRILLLLVVLGGCGRRTWEAEIASDAAAPVTVTKVKAHESTAMRVGAGGVSIGSDAPVNSISFELALAVGDRMPKDGIVGTRSACTVDGVVWATPFVGDATFADASAGSARTSFASQFMPNAFAAGPPSACEVQVRVQVGRVGDDVEPFAPIDVARFCWTPNGISSGACSTSDVPRTVPSGKVVAGPIRAAWQRDGARVLGMQARITVGENASAGDVVAAAACIGDGAPVQSRFSAIEVLHDYAAGESFVLEGTAYDRDAFASPPSRCTIELRHRDGARVASPIASFCLAGDVVSDGACEGLAPGPAIVRVTGQEATIERGAHREGPIALGPAPSAEAWEAIVGSIRGTHDEGLVFVAPRELAANRALALVDAAERAGVAIAMREPS